MEKYLFLVHVPHASIVVPSSFYLDKDIMEEIIYEADLYMDLFIPKDNKYNLIFPYSRMYCDVERYLDDSKEVMSNYGMGVIYNRDSNGKEIKNSDKKDYIIKNYYNKHHKLLDSLSNELIKKYNYCYIIDLHSYSDDFVYKLFKKDNNPDICIGYEEGYVDKKLLINTINYFSDCGYGVKCNYPYEGSIIPNKFYGSNKVSSIMIEINKRIYLDDNKYLNLKAYVKLKKCIDNYYNYLNDYIRNMLK